MLLTIHHVELILYSNFVFFYNFFDKFVRNDITHENTYDFFC